MADYSYSLTVLIGTLAAKPERREFESGNQNARLLVTVRNEEPRRTDVIPVLVWADRCDNFDAITALDPGDRVHVVARLERRFWDGADGRRGKIEVVALAVSLPAEAEVSK